MNVVAVNIRAPGDDVGGRRKLLGIGAKADANYRFQAFLAGSGADAALQLRRAQAVEETAIHGSAIERAERAAVRVGQDGFGAVFRNDLAQSMRNFVESLVPGDALKSSRWSDGRPRPSFQLEASIMCGAGALARVRTIRARSLRLHPSHGIQHAIWRVHAFQILRAFGPKESAGNGMLRIALNFGGAPVIAGDHDAAAVIAVL